MREQDHLRQSLERAGPRQPGVGPDINVAAHRLRQPSPDGPERLNLVRTLRRDSGMQPDQALVLPPDILLDLLSHGDVLGVAAKQNHRPDLLKNSCDSNR